MNIISQCVVNANMQDFHIWRGGATNFIKLKQNRVAFTCVAYCERRSSIFLCLQFSNIFPFHTYIIFTLYISQLQFSDVNECDSNPCQNGQCIDGYNSYTCECPDDRTGLNCERSKIHVLLLLLIL